MKNNIFAKLDPKHLKLLKLTVCSDQSKDLVREQIEEKELTEDYSECFEELMELINLA